MQPSRFNAHVSLVSQDNMDRAIDEIFEAVDTAFRNGAFADVDELLAVVIDDIDQTPLTLLISYLTITKAAKSRLRNREALYHATYTIAEEQRENPRKLMQGLE